MQEIAYINCVLDFATFSVSAVDKTYDEIVAMINAGQLPEIRGTYALFASPVNIVYMPLSAYIKEENMFLFTGMVQAVFNGVMVILSLSAMFHSNNTVSTKVRVVSATDVN